MFLLQILGGDVDWLHPAADGEADHVHDSHGVGHLARHFTGTHFRLEGRGLAPSGRGQTAVSHQPRRWLSGRRRFVVSSWIVHQRRPQRFQSFGWKCFFNWHKSVNIWADKNTPSSWRGQRTGKRERWVINGRLSWKKVTWTCIGLRDVSGLIPLASQINLGAYCRSQYHKELLISWRCKVSLLGWLSTGRLWNVKCRAHSTRGRLDASYFLDVLRVSKRWENGRPSTNFHLKR